MDKLVTFKVTEAQASFIMNTFANLSVNGIDNAKMYVKTYQDLAEQFKSYNESEDKK